MEAIKISERVYWVGAIDWNLREFHGYATGRGTTYNAYLITGEKNILIDTVKAHFKDEMLARISSVLAPSKIDYIVSNHSEMDHSGCLPEIIKLVKPEKVFASAQGANALKDHFHLQDEITVVKDGETLKFGNISLSFYETRMLHWPDSMFTYYHEDNVLFSQDAFGMHLATSERFIDEVDEEIWKYEAKKYYANIILPYSNFVEKLLAKLNSEAFKHLNVATLTVAPDHGPIFRPLNINPLNVKPLNLKPLNVKLSAFEQILGLYKQWAEQKPEKRAVIVYDTMWNSTEAMAQAIADGIISTGVNVKVMGMKAFDRSDVATEIHCAGALIVGSPTLNNGLFPTMADVLTYVKGLRPKNLIGCSFGSYGWGGESITQLNEILKSMKVNIVHEGLKVKYVPKPEDLNKCFELGKFIAEKL